MEERGHGGEPRRIGDRRASGLGPAAAGWDQARPLVGADAVRPSPLGRETL